MLSEFDFFPRTSYWRPTDAWERAWRRNLARAPRRRSPEESQHIKDTVYKWRELSPNERPTLEQLRPQFDPPVTKQYLSRLAHTLPPDLRFRRSIIDNNTPLPGVVLKVYSRSHAFLCRNKTREAADVRWVSPVLSVTSPPVPRTAEYPSVSSTSKLGPSSS